jgi:DNA polymerase-3 subunit delta'
MWEDSEPADSQEELFQDALIGHEWAAGLLQSSIDSHKLSHAYVFSGPNGIGKSFLAHHFVMALSCQNPPAKIEGQLGFRFCGECRACRMIREDKYPDVSVISLEWQARMESGTGSSSASATLKIDTIRAMQLDVSRAPLEAPRRVFIVEDAATMQIAAANAFLKTLEEPPARALIILICDSDRSLLPTIVSRCQVFDLRSVPTETIEKALDARGADQTTAHKLAALAVGRPGYALRAFYDKTHQDVDDRDEAVQEMETLLKADQAARLAFSEELNSRWAGQGERRASVVRMLNLWLGWWRDLLLVYNGQGRFATNQDKLDTLQAQVDRLHLGQIKEMLQWLTRAQSELDSNVSPRLALGDLFVNHLPRL